MTFSIVARDPETGAVGVAVASKFLAVGSVVPWAQADAGAVATQSYANPTFGPDGLDLLAGGGGAQDVLDELLAADEGREERQVGVVDVRGNAATFTGDGCLDWAGGRTGDGYACQGNILAGADVVDAMAEAYEATDGDLPARLLAALEAGDAAGGDRRGRQSAALYIAKPGGGYGAREMGWDFDRWIDLRVDDHQDPVGELQRLLRTWRLYFTEPSGEVLEVEGEVRRELARVLRKLGHLDAGEELTLERFQDAMGAENFEERMLEGWRIDPDVMAHLREAADRRG